MSELLTHSGPYNSLLPEALRDPSAIHTLEGQEANRKLAQAYVDSGVDAVGSNSYRTKALRRDDVLYEDALRAQIELTRSVAGKLPVWACLGTNTCEGEKVTEEDALEAQDIQLRLAQLLGADRIVFEAVGGFDEAKALAELAKRYNAASQVIINFRPVPDLPDGTPLPDVVRAVRSIAPVEIGFNCCTPTDLLAGLQSIVKVVKDFRPFTLYTNGCEDSADAVTQLDNADQSIGPKNARETFKNLAAWAHQFGASYISGCCGHDPRTLKDAVEVLGKRRAA